jgi:hypothetical protein
VRRGDAIFTEHTASVPIYTSSTTNSDPVVKPWWWRYDPVLLLLLAAFVAFEIVAHFHYHNANGWETLSNRIVAFEQRYGWPARVVVYAALAALAVHLWGGVF